jgi:hypothetical protein
MEADRFLLFGMTRVKSNSSAAESPSSSLILGDNAAIEQWRTRWRTNEHIIQTGRKNTNSVTYHL